MATTSTFTPSTSFPVRKPDVGEHIQVGSRQLDEEAIEGGTTGEPAEARSAGLVYESVGRAGS